MPTTVLHNKTKQIQEACGTFHLYAPFIDGIMLPALRTLANQQNETTNTIMLQLNHILDYCASHPDNRIQYYPSNMKLQI